MLIQLGTFHQKSREVGKFSSKLVVVKRSEDFDGIRRRSRQPSALFAPDFNGMRVFMMFLTDLDGFRRI